MRKRGKGIGGMAMCAVVGGLLLVGCRTVEEPVREEPHYGDGLKAPQDSSEESYPRQPPPQQPAPGHY